MSNRFKRGLLNKLNQKEEEIKEQIDGENDEITFEKLEKAEKLRSELEKPLLDQEKFEKLESRIDEL